MTDNPAGHLHAIFFGDLGMCGCGNPGDAYALVKQLLELAPYWEAGKPAQVEALIGSPGATHMVLSMLEKAGLMSHSTMIEWSALTAKGRYALAAMQRVTWEEVDEAGFPHDGDDCTEACWEVSA